MQISNQKAPFSHRFLIVVFSSVFGILVFWLLSFLIDDVGNSAKIDREKFEEQFVDKNLREETKELETQIFELGSKIQSEQEKQTILENSTSNSQQTMNQLLEMQKLGLQKGIKPSETEQKALAESQQTFLQNQTKFQELNSKISELTEEKRNLEARQQQIQTKIEEQRKPAEKEFQAKSDDKNLEVAIWKLAILIPFLLLAFFLFWNKKWKTYNPVVYAFGISVLLKISRVMHEHFPSRYFKYILILLALGIVLKILLFLLKMIAAPKKDWLLKQYREAYEKFLCPVCEFPIRRGELKFHSKKNLKVLPLTQVSQSEKPYNCPVCGKKIYEECENCQKVRASLLPFCEHCGKEFETN